MLSRTKCYVTTPGCDLAAPQGIGSLYTAILCDAVAGHKRMCGFNVACLREVNTHGVNVNDLKELSGEEQVTTVMQNWHAFQEVSAEIGSTNFSWVSSTEHIHACQIFLQRIMRCSPSAIYKAKYEGRYCIEHKIAISDSPDPANCTLCNRPAKLVSEDRYFFRLSAFQGRLAAIYKYHPEFLIPPCFIQEIESALREDLRDIPISRKSKDGIPWPGDPDQSVDTCYAALATYLSGIGFATEVQETNAVYAASQGLGWITLLLHPVLPQTTAAIWKSLGQTTPLENPLIYDTPLVFLTPGSSRRTTSATLFPGKQLESLCARDLRSSRIRED